MRQCPGEARCLAALVALGVEAPAVCGGDGAPIQCASERQPSAWLLKLDVHQPSEIVGDLCVEGSPVAFALAPRREPAALQ